MKIKTIAAFLTIASLSASVLSGKDSPDQRGKTRKMAATTLTDLSKLEPSGQAAIQKSAGYAVFNSMGTHLLLVSTARGAGVAVDSKTKQETFMNKQETFMKMISGGAGLGIGVKDYRVIFVFETPDALVNFLNSGWAGSAEADAAAKANKSAGAAMISPGVYAYQIAKNGLALQLTLQDTKYSKNDGPQQQVEALQS